MSETPDQEQVIAEAREKLEGITPGTWRTHQYDPDEDLLVVLDDGKPGVAPIASIEGQLEATANAHFIAAAPCLVRGLLAICEEPRALAIEALEFASGAIHDAIGLEDGLDGLAGERVLGLIRRALEANGRPLPPVPREDQPTASAVYSLEGSTHGVNEEGS